MNITGTQTIAAPRQLVWEALNDPNVLKRCLPGCQSVERVTPEELKVVMAAAIGPLRARFNGVLRMTDVQAPSACTMVFEGQGGAIGFGKGQSSVKLSESAGQTELTYSAEAQVGGKLAQVGSRLIDGVARKMADDFFKAFKTQLAAPTSAATDSAPANAGKPAEPVAAAAPVPPSPVRVPTEPAADVAVAPLASASSGVAATSASSGVAATSASSAPTVMVPGWWLGVAAGFGSLATIAGLLLAR
jgi:carbon monoxide dehydrogenase subunit G